MCYVGYMKNQKVDQVLQQIEMVEQRIEECNNTYTMKKLIVLRRKLKTKIDNY